MRTRPPRCCQPAERMVARRRAIRGRSLSVSPTLLAATAALGQVLTHDQLNAVVDYLDAEDRLTRRWLLGAGIVCGLEVTSDLQGYVKVGRGCALTTRGDLLVVDEPLELRFSRKFHDEDAYFAPKFVDCIRELVDGSRQDAEPLQFKRLKERVVVLYLDVDDEKMSTCGAVDCNDLPRSRCSLPILRRRVNMRGCRCAAMRSGFPIWGAATARA